MSFSKTIIGISLLLTTYSVNAANIFTEFPEKIDSKQSYVFYSHGLVLEGNIDKPYNLNKPVWGIYDFPAVKESLSDGSYNLIAYHREKNTDPYSYAKKLAHDVNQLIQAGVPEQHIALVGFSRGGEITMLASNELKNKNLNFVIRAGCDGIVKNNNIQLYGNIFSIFETSDEVGSCEFMKKRSPEVTGYQEISISTGQQHGVFFRPNKAWVSPVKQWLKFTISQ